MDYMTSETRVDDELRFNILAARHPSTEAVYGTTHQRSAHRHKLQVKVEMLYPWIEKYEI